MYAFAPITPVASMSSTFSGSAVKLVRRLCTGKPVAPIGRRVSAPQTTMTDGDKTIDFSKINIQDAPNNLAGLVFKPETDSSLKTRVDVGSFNDEIIAGINGQINVEYTAMYAYHALWAYFDRDMVALKGFANYFLDQSKEEREHAHEFMQYQNMRGGTIELQPIAVPEMKFTREDGTSDALYAMDLHLQLEKFVYSKIKSLQKLAEEADDSQMQDFLDDFLGHQVAAIKQASDFVSQVKRAGTPHGVFHMDLDLRQKYGGAAP